MEQLLTTKLYIPPTRPELVPRPRLVKQLNEGLHRKLTLISAPAGYGKTTLASDWVAKLQAPEAEHNKCRIAWLSLDHDDNDLVRFTTYLIATLNHEPRDGSILGGGVLDMIQSPQQPPVEAIMTNLINEISSVSDQIMLVLDDYHLIDASQINEALTFLIEHQPDHLHIVITTRDDPLLPLARLRARAQMTELRAADLRFTSSEAAAFLNQAMGLGLSEEDVSALEARTEGWIAGLQLVAISIRGHEDTSSMIESFTGSHRYVFDYLIEELLEQQSEMMQLFLLQTAILERFNNSLCDAVRFGNTEPPVDQLDSRVILDKIEHSNLFIVPLDGERKWYRYHHLFADILRQRMRTMHPEQIPLLHSRASDWYEENGLVDEAIDHALRAEDFDRAAELIEQAADAVWVRGEDTKMRQWLSELPEEMECVHPRLCIFDAWYRLAAGQQEKADRYLLSAKKALEHGPQDDGGTATSDRNQHQEQTRKLRGMLATTMAFSGFYHGDVELIIENAQKALDLLPEEEIYWRSTAVQMLGDGYDLQGDMDKAYKVRMEAVDVSDFPGNEYQFLIVNLKLALILRHQGDLKRVKEICVEQITLSQDFSLSGTVAAGLLLAILGEVLAETNDLDTAITKANEGVAIAERGGDMAMLGWGFICLIRVLYSRCDLSSAQEIIYKLESTARKSFIPPWIMNQKAAWQARIWLADNRLASAAQWAGDRDLDVDGEILYLREVEYNILARVLIAQERPYEAISLLERMLEGAEAGGRTSMMIEILLLIALANQAGSDSDQAINSLERALILAEPGGYIRTFVDEGPSMARLLHQAQSFGTVPDYIRQILGAFPVDEPQVSEQRNDKTATTSLIEPLSDREIEVLQLIAEGLTNPEIAAHLYLSLNTVKVHTRNIYGKLGVNNRTQAVSKARALGVLDW